MAPGGTRLFQPALAHHVIFRIYIISFSGTNENEITILLPCQTPHTPHRGPTLEIDPYELRAHNCHEPNAMRGLERKEFFGSNWILGRIRESRRSSFTSSIVISDSGLAGVRKVVMVWLVLQRY